MANQTFNQLTTVAGEGLDRAADKIAIWDNSATTTKGMLTQDVVTTGVQDPTGATTTRVNKMVALNQAAYSAIVTPDPQTLYVITDGVTLDSYNGQIDTPAASKNYYLDLQAVSDRTIVKFQILYTSGASGAGTITLKVNGGGTPGTNEDTITFAASQTNQPAGGGAISLAATAGQEIRLETNASVADVTNLAFIVEYEV